MSIQKDSVAEPVLGSGDQPVQPPPIADPSAEDAALTPEVAPEDQPYQLTIVAPNGARIPIVATAQETILDIKQVVSETPETIEYSCFYLALKGTKLNDFSELGEIEDLEKDGQLELIEDTYTEREARLHVSRLRDLLAGPGSTNPQVVGLDAGSTVFSTIKYPDGAPADSSGAETNSVSESDNASSRSTGSSSGKKRAKNKKRSQETKPPTKPTPDTSAPAHDPKAADHAFKDFEIGKVPQFEILSTDVAHKQLHVPKCIKQLTLSGWNPVPRYRQLKGDLLYLVVTTLENQTYQITASRSGFYVNSSSLTNFNPDNYAVTHSDSRESEFYHAHSLITLLGKLSPKFSQNLNELQKEMGSREILEVLPFVSARQAATPWLVRAKENQAPTTYDLGRPQDVFLRLGTQVADSLRDWNEELQSIREMPRATLSERVLRDRQLHKWHSEFSEAAIQGAMAVVESEMQPLNPTDPEDQFMYLRDNIFFSKGFDGRDTFTDLGGDAAAHVATGKDITGVRLLSQLDIQGLNTLGSVVVDYRGVRVVAQSVVPGIFRRQESSPIIYGSVDNGKTVRADEGFHKAIEPVAKALHFAEHSVYDEDGNEAKLYTSVDVKGLVGADGRKYVLDLYRMTPIDIEFLETECGEGERPAYPHRLVLLRPELLELFWENSVRKAIQEYASEKIINKKDKGAEGTDETEKAKEAEKTDEAEKDKQTDEAEKDKQTDEAEKDKQTDEAEEAEKAKQAEADLMEGFEFNMDFSPDAFAPIQSQNPAGPSSADEALSEAVRDASKFLNSTSIPILARDLASYNTSPLSGSALTSTMHQRGINMRYLGKLAQLLPADVDAVQNVRRLVIREMIARAIKHIVRTLFRTVPTSLHQEAFALVINALLGSKYCSDPTQELSSEAKAVAALNELTPAELARQIRAQVSQRFRFTLDEDFAETYVTGYERILLREIALKCGVQLALRQYTFERPAEAAVYAQASIAVLGEGDKKANKQVKRQIRELADKELARPLAVLPSEVMNFAALTKNSTHNSTFADEAFEAGRVSLEQGQKELGIELLLESLALHEQTYGFLHSESARCYAVVSLAHHDAGQYDLAAEFMTKSVVISERTVGLDDPFTIHNYLNLALYEHARGNTVIALRLMRRAVDLWALVNSPDHPDLATAHNNIGVMLQAIHKYDDALAFFESCVAIRTRLVGSESVLVANAQHSLAKAYAVTGDFKSAVDVERDALKVFADKFGDEDPRTKEALTWLNEFTFHAVEEAKVSKVARQKIIRDAKLIHVERDDKAPEGTASSTASKGHLPIDELLKFITGSGAMASGAKAKGGRKGKGPGKRNSKN